MSELNVIMYHYVRNVSIGRYPKMKALEYENFKKQLMFLRQKFRFVTMEEVTEAYYGGKELPENAVLLTFDDGYTDSFLYVFPLLKKEGIQGSFFISTEGVFDRRLMDVNKLQFVLSSVDSSSVVRDVKEMLDYYRSEDPGIPDNETLFGNQEQENRLDTKDVTMLKELLQFSLPERIRGEINSRLFEKYVDVSETALASELYLNRDQIECMQKYGMHIGLHGHRHIWLEYESGENIKKEIDTALNNMDGLIEKENWTMSYPYGSYNPDLISYIQDKGCRIGFSSDVGRNTVAEEEKYRILRYDTIDFPPIGDRYLQP